MWLKNDALTNGDADWTTSFKHPQPPSAQGNETCYSTTMFTAEATRLIAAHNADIGAVRIPVATTGIDVNTPTGAGIPIEERKAQEAAQSEMVAVSASAKSSAEQYIALYRQQVSDTAAQAAPSLSQSTAAELGGAALGATDGRHCSRCEEITLVASSFGGLCYYCHSFPHAETWRQLRARFVLLAAFRASPSSSEHLPRASSMFDLPGLELQV